MDRPRDNPCQDSNTPILPPLPLQHHRPTAQTRAPRLLLAPGHQETAPCTLNLESAKTQRIAIYHNFCKLHSFFFFPPIFTTTPENYRNTNILYSCPTPILSTKPQDIYIYIHTTIFVTLQLEAKNHLNPPHPHSAPSSPPPSSAPFHGQPSQTHTGSPTASGT
jgi:hypothetical protein